MEFEAKYLAIRNRGFIKVAWKNKTAPPEQLVVFSGFRQFFNCRGNRWLGVLQNQVLLLKLLLDS